MILRKWFEGIRDKIADFFKNFYKNLKSFRIKVKLSKKIIIIIVSVVAVILLAAAGGYYYYFYIYTKPNFENGPYNNVMTSSVKEVEPGDTLGYEINYKNTGYRKVDSLSILIQMPDNIELTSYTEGGEYSENTKTLKYTINNIIKETSGMIELELKIDEPLDNGIEIKLEDVRFDYSIGDESFEVLIDSGEGHTVKSSPDLTSFSISSSDLNGGLISLGDEIRYTIKIKNTGNMIARNIDVISEPSIFIEPTKEDISSSGKLSDGKIIWKLDELKPGDSETLIFKAVLMAGEIEDREEIVTGASILYDSKEIASEQIVDIARLFPDFSESIAVVADANGGGYLWAGETVNVRVSIKNTGQRKADEYQLYCPIPDPATYVSQSGTAEGIRWDDGIRGLVWDLSGLEVGESRDITFNMTVNNDYYYKSGTINTEFYIIAGDDEFPIDPVSIYIQGHPYLNVVVMGDSLIAKSDWVQRLDNKLEATFPAADYNTVPSAVSGEMSFQGLARFDSTVGPLHPTILVIAYGTNDTGISYSYFKYSIDTMVAKAKNLGATVFINTIGPISTAGKEDWPRYNQAIMEVSAKYGVPVIDVASQLSTNKGGYLSDGMHYTPAGAEVVAQTVFNNIVLYLNGLGGRR